MERQTAQTPDEEDVMTKRKPNLPKAVWVVLNESDVPVGVGLTKALAWEDARQWDPERPSSATIRYIPAPRAAKVTEAEVKCLADTIHAYWMKCGGHYGAKGWRACARLALRLGARLPAKGPRR